MRAGVADFVTALCCKAMTPEKNGRELVRANWSRDLMRDKKRVKQIS
jgi:hypothetical protein